MHHDVAKSRAIDAFIRRFPECRSADLRISDLQPDFRISDPQPGYLRVTDARSGTWIDFDVSGWRIRVIAQSRGELKCQK